MVTVELGLALCLAVAALGAVAKWLPLPLPIILVAGGALLSYVPGLAGVELDPQVFFLLFVPPLLFADGWLFPKREFFAFLRPILLLAFGLVAATVVAVGYLMHWLIPSLPLAAAFALGAIVSPTDAVATASVTQRLPLPTRVTHIVNGESLINDASGLVAFKFAVAAVATGAFSWLDALGQLALLAGGGALAGLAVAALIGATRARLVRFCVDDPKIQTIISLLTPYAAYLAAEKLQISGVLAIVASGLYAGIHDSRHLSLATRRHAWEVWSMLLYVFNSLAFLLLGLQLRRVMLGTPGVALHELLGYAAVLFVAINVVRLLWVYPGVYVPYSLSKRARAQGPRDPRAVFLLGWAGIRGSVTLAAGLSIPYAMADGAPFPGRDLILFLAGTTIILTLCVNGLTLPLAIRALHLRDDGESVREERGARVATTRAAAGALRTMLPGLTDADDVAVATRLLADYETRIARYEAGAPLAVDGRARTASERGVRLAAINAERSELRKLVESGAINDETLRAIEAEIDHLESLVVGDTRAT